MSELEKKLEEELEKLEKAIKKEIKIIFSIRGIKHFMSTTSSKIFYNFLCLLEVFKQNLFPGRCTNT
jgi:hypothetical protein